MAGFGWNFYAFFIAAAAWVILYNLWAWRLNRSGRSRKQ
jgi:hypothetical protein